MGVGLPQVNPRQEMLRRYYDAAPGGTGFDYAYRCPGMNKVLQAAGRVIRTSEDKGVVLLLDDRFARSEYTRLFPVTGGTCNICKTLRPSRKHWALSGNSLDFPGIGTDEKSVTVSGFFLSNFSNFIREK